MKKLILCILLLVPVLASAQSTTASKLMGLGMPAQVAKEVEKIARIPNGSYLQGVDESGNYHDILGVDSSGNTELLGDNNDIELKPGGTTVATFDSGGLDLGSNAFLGLAYAAATAAGSTMSDATDVTSSFVAITSCSGGQGIQIPNLAVGQIMWVNNSSGTACNVYPRNAGDAFRGTTTTALANGAAYSLANNASMLLIPYLSNRVLAIVD